LIGPVFLLATVVSELIFGTKVGDLAKMMRQFELDVSKH
jgi:hypothetical protein